MSLLDAVTSLDWQDPKTLGIVGGGTVAVVGYMWYSGKKKPTDANTKQANQVSASVDSAMPISDGTPAGVKGVPGWVGPIGDQSPTTPVPQTPPVQSSGPCGDGKVAIWRSGRMQCQSAPEGAYATQKCPPGYQPIYSGSVGVRCAQVNDLGNPAGPTSYIPVDLAGGYQKGYRQQAGTTPKGVGGAGPTNPVTRPIGGGFFTPAEGDTLSSIARKVYGDSALWPRLAQLNGVRATALQAGTRIRV